MNNMYYTACHKDNRVLEKSSSGGMFSAFASNILEKGGVVLGATFDSDERRVKHIAITDLADLDKLRKSKYVYSDFQESIAIIEKAIIEDIYILFTGTPCQAAAIKSKFVDYEKLYIVDLFCHGTIDPSLLTEYLDTFDTQIKNICFREQEKKTKDNFQFCVYEKEGMIVSDVYINNPLTYIFLTSEGIRDACFTCRYASDRHLSDITIGDWTYDYPAKWDELYEYVHPSIVSINNEKGKEFFKECSAVFYSHNVDEKKEEIKSYYRSHDTMKGLWGYDLDKKIQFEELRKEKGFLYAAEYSMYESERRLIERAIAKGNRHLCLYGCGYNGKRISRAISRFYKDCVELCYFVVTENREKVEEIDNKKVFKFQDIYNDLYDKTIVLTISNEEVRSKIEAELIGKGIRNYVSW